MWKGWFTLCLLGLALLLPPGARAQPAIVGPPNAIICNGAAQTAIGVSGQTQTVAGVAGRSIYICGWHVTNSGASGTFQLSYGTGSNCGTGNALVTPAFTVTSTAPATDHIDYAVVQVPAGNALCINPSVATIAAIIWFAQF